MCVAAVSRLAHHGAVLSPRPGPRAVSCRPGRRAAAALAGLLSACKLGVYTDTASSGETGATSDSGGGDDGAPEVCLRYVACLTEIDGAAGAEAAQTHGASGSCWTGDELEAAACLTLCDVQLRNYAASFPALAACDASGIVSDATFEIGEAVFDPDDPFLPPTYRKLEADGAMTVVRGGQGLLMLPFALRGRDFVITEDPNDWDHPKMPRVNLTVDIDDHNVLSSGHFANLNNYSVGFVPLNDGEGTLEHMYIAIIVPDAIADPQTLTGQHGTIHVELFTFNQPAAIEELHFVVAPAIQGL